MGCQGSFDTGKLCVFGEEPKHPQGRGGREASLQIPQILNLVFGKKLSVWFLGSLQFVSIKKPICEEIAVLLGIVFLFVTQSVEINCHS